jgi:hypothetical protein
MTTETAAADVGSPTIVASGVIPTFTISSGRAALFGRILAGVGTAASDDAARGVMCGVQIRAAGTLLTFTATDSYHAIRATFETGDPLGDWETVIHADVLADVATAIGKNKNVPVTVGGVAERPGSLVVRVAGSPIVFDCPAMVGTFPFSLDSIIAAAESDSERWPAAGTESVKIDPARMSETLMAMRKIVTAKRADVVSVAMSRVSPTKAWLFTVPTDHGSVVAVLMPMR